MGNLRETGHSWPEVSIVRQHWLSRLPGSARCRLGLGPGAPLGPRPSQLSALRPHGERGSPRCDRACSWTWCCSPINWAEPEGSSKCRYRGSGLHMVIAPRAREASVLTRLEVLRDLD